jgi:hypothetical protein
MKSIVFGVLALASGVVREEGGLFHDAHTQGMDGRPAALSRAAAEGDVAGDLTAFNSPPGPVDAGMSVDGSGGDPVEETLRRASDAARWEVACENKSGGALLFDRSSVREYGAVTLFRWSAQEPHIASGLEPVYTAVANCREKTIEPSWPGKSRETRAGTCGRGLIEAVCTAAGLTAAPAKGRRPGPTTSTRGDDSTTPRR